MRSKLRCSLSWFLLLRTNITTRVHPAKQPGAQEGVLSYGTPVEDHHHDPDTNLIIYSRVLSWLTCSSPRATSIVQMSGRNRVAAVVTGDHGCGAGTAQSARCFRREELQNAKIYKYMAWEVGRVKLVLSRPSVCRTYVHIGEADCRAFRQSQWPFMHFSGWTQWTPGGGDCVRQDANASVAAARRVQFPTSPRSRGFAD